MRWTNDFLQCIYDFRIHILQINRLCCGGEGVELAVYVKYILVVDSPAVSRLKEKID